ncbi:MAG: arylamine N-acetyltransferase [Acidobacteriota bacterium]
MDPKEYLRRIGYDGPLTPTIPTLTQLHSAHLYAVPFENLDIPLGTPIQLSLPALFDKIVRRRRGGFCYELNSLFRWLLQEIGFEVQMLSGRVFNGSAPGPEFDHMLLQVDTERQFVADVGFGDSFIEPLVLSQEVQAQNADNFRLDKEGDEWVLFRRKPGADWEPQYVFSLKPRQIEEFGEMCRFHQTSPESPFPAKSLCSLATHEGRVTLSNDRFIVTSRGHREEHAIAGPEEYRNLLRTHFGLELSNDVDAATLLAPGRRAR